jgi:hypothetical protein
MEFKTIQGIPKRLKRPRRYIIDWDAGSRSKLQKKVKDAIWGLWKYDVVFEEFPIVGTRLSLDFFNATTNVAIEVQGNQHTKFVKFFHRSKSNYLDQIYRDVKKADFCEANDIELLEIFENDFDIPELLSVINEA